MYSQLNIKIDASLKEEAELLAEKLGFSLSSITRAFLKEFVRKKKIAFALEENDTPENITGKDVKKAFIESGHDTKYAKAQKKSYDAMLKDEKNNRLTEWE